MITSKKGAEKRETRSNTRGVTGAPQLLLLLIMLLLLLANPSFHPFRIAASAFHNCNCGLRPALDDKLSDKLSALIAACLPAAGSLRRNTLRGCLQFIDMAARRQRVANRLGYPTKCARGLSGLAQSKPWRTAECSSKLRLLLDCGSSLSSLPLSSRARVGQHARHQADALVNRALGRIRSESRDLGRYRSLAG
jgi:hypothetical protein